MLPVRKVADMVAPVEWGTELMSEMAEKMVAVAAEVEEVEKETECCSPLQLKSRHLFSEQV